MYTIFFIRQSKKQLQRILQERLKKRQTYKRCETQSHHGYTSLHVFVVCRQLRQLLSAQKEVESLSGELVTYWKVRLHIVSVGKQHVYICMCFRLSLNLLIQQRGMDKREGMDSLKHTLSPDLQRNLSSYINEAYQRCSTNHQTSA